MLPVCVAIASVAMFSGISGAALLTPVFLIWFPLLGVPRLSTAAAIGTALHSLVTIHVEGGPRTGRPGVPLCNDAHGSLAARR